jgi:ribosome maturation factor RimP
MNNETIISTVTQKLEVILQDNPTVFLVEIRIKPTNNIKVFIDGDNGVGIDRLVSYNRQLYKQLEELAIFPEGDFSLEVSSPGLSEPLKMHRQYVKNTGRFVEVVLLDGTQVEGKMITVTDTEITLEEERGKGKKKETVQHIVAFSNIKTTKIQIKF